MDDGKIKARGESKLVQCF